MVFLFNLSFPGNKLVKRCLETFFGLGHQRSSRLLAKYSIYPRAKMGELSTKTTLALTNELSEMPIENVAKAKVLADIARLRDIGSYRGKRHAAGYPVRGQRTRSQILNARRLNRIERKL